jgi:hypothetical protein
VRVGIVGTPAGITHFRTWMGEIKKGITVPPPGKGEKQDRLHLANFPGLEEAFQIAIDERFLVALTLDAKLIDRTSRILNHHEAVSKVVDLYASRVRRHIANDERAVYLWVLVVPELVFERCRPEAKRAGLPMEKGDFGKKQRKRSDLPLLNNLVDHAAEEIFDDVPDFHRQVKAAFLTISPTQILRETTLAPAAFLNKAGYPIRKFRHIVMRDMRSAPLEQKLLLRHKEWHSGQMNVRNRSNFTMHSNRSSARRGGASVRSVTRNASPINWHPPRRGRH